MGIEPTPRTATARDYGFEDRERHQPLGASACWRRSYNPAMAYARLCGGHGRRRRPRGGRGAAGMRRRSVLPARHQRHRSDPPHWAGPGASTEGGRRGHRRQRRAPPARRDRRGYRRTGRARSRSIRAGVDLVCFSGDKLLGGPQAGIIAGSREAVELCRRHPLFRAVRPGRLIYTALEATLRIYRDGDARALREIPAVRSLLAREEDLRERAEELAGRIQALEGLDVTAVPCVSQAGSGSLPAREYPSWGVSLGYAPVRVRRELSEPATTSSARPPISSSIGRETSPAAVDRSRGWSGWWPIRWLVAKPCAEEPRRKGGPETRLTCG